MRLKLNNLKMETEILNSKENKFFNREELEANIQAEKNPSFVEVAEVISEKIKVNKDNIFVKRIKGKFGSNNFLISAEIYKSKEERDKQAEKFVKNKKEVK